MLIGSYTVCCQSTLGKMKLKNKELRKFESLEPWHRNRTT